MNKYWAVVRIAGLSVFENRLHILVANLQAVFALFVLYYFWKTVFGESTEIKGYSFSQMITYYFIIRVTYNRVSAFTAGTVAKSIKSGEISQHLVRPYNFTYYFTSQDFTKATLWTLGNLVAILIFSIYMYKDLVGPASFVYGLLFLIVFLLNGLLSIGININVGYVAFWIGEITHLKFVTTSLITILSGGLIPLTFMPWWFQKVSKYLPFKYLVQFPTDVYFGKLNGGECLLGVTILTLWILALYGLANYLLKKGLKSYESYN